MLLAAGGSSRLGRPKQLLVHRGEPLVRRAARAALDAGAAPVVAVLGADADAVRAALAGLPGVRTVVNAQWATGLASSLAAGIGAVLGDGAHDAEARDGVLVLLADQPLVDADALRRLLQAFDAGHRVVASSYAGTLGVPAVFGREHLAALQAIGGDRGAGAWLRERRAEVTAVPMDAAALDVDTAADVARLAGHGGAEG